MASILATDGDRHPSMTHVAPPVWVSVIPTSKSCITKSSGSKGRLPVRGDRVGLALVAVSC